LFKSYLVNINNIPDSYLKILITVRTLVYIMLRKNKYILRLWNYIFYIYKKDGVVLKSAVKYILLFRVKLIFLITSDLSLPAKIINILDKRVRYMYCDVLLFE